MIMVFMFIHKIVFRVLKYLRVDCVECYRNETSDKQVCLMC